LEKELSMMRGFLVGETGKEVGADRHLNVRCFENLLRDLPIRLGPVAQRVALKFVHSFGGSGTLSRC
jgi:hypothetical protein